MPDHDGGTSIVGDAQPTTLPPPPPAGTLESILTQTSYVFVGSASARTNDAVRVEEDFAGTHWVFFYDEVILTLERAIGAMPPGGEHLVLFPTHCEAFQDGGLVTNLVHSKCTARHEYNSVEIGDRVIAFNEGLPGYELPPRLYFKLAVAPDNTVDLRNVQETDAAAPLELVIARLAQFISDGG